VKPGENLFRIALNSGTNYQTLAQLNNIPAPYTVFPGQVLKMP
jgi:LysM repeat protein